jgi:hypothetical protein
MQIRVQNKSKSVWKSGYDGDVSGFFSLFDLQYHVLLDVLGVLSDVIFFCGVFIGIR